MLEQGDTKKALSILERSREEGVQDIRLSASLADAYRQSKLYDKALDEINKAFDLMHEGKSIRSVVTF